MLIYMVNNVRVLFIWRVPPTLQEYILTHLTPIPSIHLIFLDNPTEEALLAHASNVDVIIGWRPSETLISSSPNLRFLINPGAGVQHLIPLLCKINVSRSQTPIILINGHGNAYFTAQHAVALLLNLTNHVVLHHLWMQQGKWRTGDTEAKSLPLRYQSIGLLGFGAVNRYIYQFIHGFEPQISICRKNWEGKPLPEPSFPVSNCFSFNQLNDFLAKINILIIAVPHTHLTENLIHQREIECMLSPRLLINISRGSIVNERDLYECLEQKILAGAGIDVWYNESPSSDEEGKQYPFSPKYPFYSLPNVILSPHRAASPFDDLHRWDEVIENLKRISNGREDLLNRVNLIEEY